MKIKHATAGAFLFAPVDGAWKLGLIDHPRLHRWMTPGGHVEADEHCAEAACREVREETGLPVSMLPSPGAMRLPEGFPHTIVPAPWWITEIDVPPDSHLAEPHIHVDHQYVSVVTDLSSQQPAEHELRWFAEHELADVRMFDDARLLARELFGRIGNLAADVHADRVVAALGRRPTSGSRLG